jgi:mutator protein MutT
MRLPTALRHKARTRREIPMSAVECTTLYGRKKQVPRDSLVLRPAAYAIIVNEGRLLLLTLRHSGKYHLPGGRIEAGERVEETLRREIEEETGIAVEVGELARFREVFFYYDPSETAYHGLHFYYLCSPATLELVADEEVRDSSAERPRWVEIRGLQAEDFQVHGELILQLADPR